MTTYIHEEKVFDKIQHDLKKNKQSADFRGTFSMQ